MNNIYRLKYLKYSDGTNNFVTTDGYMELGIHCISFYKKWSLRRALIRIPHIFIIEFIELLHSIVNNDILQKCGSCNFGIDKIHITINKVYKYDTYYVTIDDRFDNSKIVFFLDNDSFRNNITDMG